MVGYTNGDQTLRCPRCWFLVEKRAIFGEGAASPSSPAGAVRPCVLGSPDSRRARQKTSNGFPAKRMEPTGMREEKKRSQRQLSDKSLAKYGVFNTISECSPSLTWPKVWDLEMLGPPPPPAMPQVFVERYQQVMSSNSMMTYTKQCIARKTMVDCVESCIGMSPFLDHGTCGAPRTPNSKASYAAEDHVLCMEIHTNLRRAAHLHYRGGGAASKPHPAGRGLGRALCRLV